MPVGHTGRVTLPQFDYIAPRSLDEALTALQDSREVRPLAGGQSLMPVLAFRLASPSLLVDLRHLDELRRIEIGEQAVTLGAMVRWCDIERSAALAVAQPLLFEAVSHIAHYQIRNRGTVGGSLAHADPAAELPAVAVACDATLLLASAGGRRSLAATEFFVGPLSTALLPGELVVGLRLPAWPAARRWAFCEFSRRRGDFALAGVALRYELDGDGGVADARIAAFGVGPTPLRLTAAEDALNGRRVDEAAVGAVCDEARREVDPPDDLHASARYRRALLGTLVERALAQAAKGDRPC